MRTTHINADMSHQNTMVYKFGEFIDSLYKNGLLSTARKVGQRIYYKSRGLDFSTENIYNLTRIGAYQNHGTAFVPTSKDFLQQLIEDLEDAIDGRLDRELFVDCGSGKGSAIIHARKIGFKRSIGVEFAQELHIIAEANIEKLKLKSTDSIYGDVTTYQIPNDVSVIYLFNPFDEVVMEKFLENLLRQKSSFGGEVYLIYKNASSTLLNKRLNLIKEIIYPSEATAHFYKL